MKTSRSLTTVIVLVSALLGCGGGGGNGGSNLGTDATLASLSIDDVTLDQVFQSTQTSYTANVAHLRSSIVVTAQTSDSKATLVLNDATIDSGTEQRLNLNTGASSSEAGVTNVVLLVTAEDGTTTKTYTVTVTRAAATSWAQRNFLKASTIESEDEFGFSVALSGDTLVVGAPREDSDPALGEGDNSKLTAGAAYVLVRDGSGWTQQAFLKADDEFDRGFGTSVAIEGDTLAVSAPVVGIPGQAVYVFTRSGTSWSQQAKLTASNADVLDGFGTSIAISGDTLVVGAPFEDSQPGTTSGSDTGATDDDSVQDNGAVYVFVRSGTLWTQQTMLKADNAGPHDHFGLAVAISGNTLLVGAPQEDSNSNISNDLGTDTGAAYLFTRTESGWSNPQRLKASNLGNGDLFGGAVAIDGDTAVIGAIGESGPTDGDSSAGAAYVFAPSNANWVERALLRAANAGAGDLFGSSVAISDQTIVVGAVFETFTSTNGAAYLFTGSDASWTQFDYLASDIKTAGVIGSNTALAGDNYGVSVAVDGDTVVVGANGEDSSTALDETDNSAVDSGAVYVWQ